MKTGSSAKGGAFVTSLLTSLVVSLIVCVCFNYFGPDVINKLLSQTSDVPNLEGMSLEEAKSAVESKKLLVSVQGEENDPKAPKGNILSQNPSTGLKVKKGTNILVVLSSGKVLVPKLEFLTLEDAKNAIAEAGLTTDEIMEEESDKVPGGAVVASDPVEATEAAQGSAVKLIVSKGVSLVKVPKIIGKRLSSAKKALAAAGLVAGNIKEETSEFYQFDIIIEQSPKEGAKAAKGSAVNFTLNVEAQEEE